MSDSDIAQMDSFIAQPNPLYEEKTGNDFQKYIQSLGYYRKEGSSLWWKEGEIVSGKVFVKLLDDFRKGNY